MSAAGSLDTAAAQAAEQAADGPAAGARWAPAIRWAAAAATALATMAVLFRAHGVHRAVARFAETKSFADFPAAGLGLVAPAGWCAGLAAFVVLGWPAAPGRGRGRRIALRAAAFATLAVAVAISAVLPAGFMALAFLVTLAVAGRAVFERFRPDRFGRVVDSDSLAIAVFALMLAGAAMPWGHAIVRGTDGSMIAGGGVPWPVAGAAPRWTSLCAAMATPLDPDGNGYVEIARGRGVYDTAFREPGFIWLFRGIRLLAGGALDAPMLRLFGFLAGLAAAAAVFFSARWLAGCRGPGLAAGAIAGTLYLQSRFMTITATRGLREDCIVVGLLAFTAACVAMVRARARWGWYGPLGLLACGLCLVRLSSFGFVFQCVAVMLAIGWRALPGPVGARTLRTAAAATLFATCAVLPAVPFFMASQREYKNPYLAIDMHTRFYANVELAGKHSDMPTKAQAEADGYAGPPISMGTYLFKYHSLGQIAANIIEGARRLLSGDFFQQAFVFGPGVPWPGWFWLCVAALPAVAWPPRRTFFIGAILWFHAPALFLMSFPWFDPRLASTFFATYYLVLGIGAAGAYLLLRRVLAGLDTAPATPAYKSAPRRPLNPADGAASAPAGSVPKPEPVASVGAAAAPRKSKKKNRR